MKITSFHPMIVSQHAEDVIALFESIGFQRAHTKTNINDAGITSVCLKNADGFHVDVASSQRVPKDIQMIRMNVDNFEEAYAYLVERGFQNAQGDRITDTGSAHATMMVSPSGFAINLVKHIKH